MQRIGSNHDLLCEVKSVCPLKGQHHYHQLSCKTTLANQIKSKARYPRRNQIFSNDSYAAGKNGLHPSRPQTLFKSIEHLSFNLKVFAPNAFPLALSPTLSQTSQTARKSEANERTRQHPNP